MQGQVEKQEKEGLMLGDEIQERQGKESGAENGV